MSVLIFQPIIGIFGDKYSRKNILLLGQIAKLTCFASFLLIPNFWGYLIGFAFWGIQWAIEASVCEAFVYDELCCLRAKSKYSDVSGRMLAFQNAGMLFSAIGSFIAAKYGYNSVLMITIGAMFLSLLVISCIKMEQPKCYCGGNNINWVNSIKNSINIIKKIKYGLASIIILSCIISVAELDDYIGLLGSEIGIKLEYIGMLFAIGKIAQFFGGFFVKYLKNIDIKIIGLLIIFMGILFSIIGFSKYMIWFILFASYFMCSVIRVLITTKIQNAIPSDNRSMILSFVDIINQISCIIFYGIITIGALIGGYKIGYLLSGFIIFILGIYSIIFLKDIQKLK